MIRNRYTAAVNDKQWWLAGGIPASACVIAYQPKGASSQDASYTNLANPGVHTAIEAVKPGWGSTIGWDFTGGNYYLVAGSYIVPTTTHSCSFKFTNLTTGSPCGVYKAVGNRWAINRKTDNAFNFYISATTSVEVSEEANGVYCMNGGDLYENGILVSSTGQTFNNDSGLMRLGMTEATAYGKLYLESFALYNINLTTNQIAALTAAMNAL